MSDRQVTVHENNYFAVRCSFQNDDRIAYWDLMRKVPLIPGAGPELLEIIAPVLVGSSTANRILIPIQDHYLLRDLQAIGCRWVGYCSQDGSDTSSHWSLWGVTRALRFEALESLDLLLESSSKHVERAVLEVGCDLSHDPPYESATYFDFARNRERYMSGLTENHYLRSKALWNHDTTPSPQSELTRPLSLRQLESFKDVVSQRKSSIHVQTGKTLSKTEIDTILDDSYYVRRDGHFPVGTAGGFRNLKLLLITEGVKDVDNGCYEIDSQKREWKLRHPGQFSDLIHRAGFSQETFKGVRVWIAVVAELHQASQKYGNRAYRFSMMGAGALSHALHLSCTSLGLEFRLMGGFDDGLLGKILQTNGSSGQMIAVMAGLGR